MGKGSSHEPLQLASGKPEVGRNRSGKLEEMVITKRYAKLQRMRHAEAVAHAALEILEEFPKLTDHTLHLRIGIHTGPVVAGVIGKNKFIYDLWGDTVNIASRMQSHGQPGSIQVSAKTYQHLNDKFEFHPRGEIEIKGKGAMQVFLLKGEKPSASFDMAQQLGVLLN